MVKTQMPCSCGTGTNPGCKTQSLSHQTGDETQAYSTVTPSSPNQSITSKQDVEGSKVAGAHENSVSAVGVVSILEVFRGAVIVIVVALSILVPL